MFRVSSIGIGDHVYSSVGVYRNNIANRVGCGEGDGAEPFFATGDDGVCAEEGLSDNGVYFGGEFGHESGDFAEGSVIHGENEVRCAEGFAVGESDSGDAFRGSIVLYADFGVDGDAGLREFLDEIVDENGEAFFDHVEIGVLKFFELAESIIGIEDGEFGVVSEAGEENISASAGDLIEGGGA